MTFRAEEILLDELRERIRPEKERQAVHDKARREALAEVDRRFR